MIPTMYWVEMKDFIKPERLVVVIVLYYVDMWIRQSGTGKDKFLWQASEHMLTSL